MSSYNNSTNSSNYDASYYTNSSNYDASCFGTDSDDAAVMMSIRIYFGATLTFIVVGLVGNALSMLVFLSREMQGVSSNVYLLTLASSDSCYLVSVFLFKTLTTLRCWYFVESALDIANRSDVWCILLQYLSDLFSNYSTCVILAFTVERAVAVFRPMRYKELCTVARARFVCALIFLVIACSIAPYHVMYIGIWVDYSVCAIRYQYEAVFYGLYVVEMFIFRLVPVAIIAIINAFIIRRVTSLARAKRQWMTGAGHGGADDPAAAAEKRRQSSQQASSLSSRKTHAEDRNLQLTIILILVSTSYVLAYIPVLLHFVMRKIQLWELITVSRKALTIVGNYSKALYVAGFSINFFLYTVSGRVFRDQLKKIVCGCCGRIGESGYTGITSSWSYIMP